MVLVLNFAGTKFSENFKFAEIKKKLALIIVTLSLREMHYSHLIWTGGTTKIIIIFLTAYLKHKSQFRQHNLSFLDIHL